ncbi:tumor necrosis factor receptor superfamily member 1B-like [Protopterus annectens]|uniref:tumor necrosis factor receptor superfamily member 1B-like n=1 Tax=Protopterus annectens TaxID=7888 RepID=UPI001CFBBB78|nr:tumor necrosis factor receptor superfamily member 1B-like [Protopterus annectens]
MRVFKKCFQKSIIWFIILSTLLVVTMNKEFSCRTCPKGFFTNVSSDQCEHCQTGTYTESENCLLKCRRCRSICRDNKFESVPCTATSNRQCSCKSSFYCKQKNEKNCEECAPCGQQGYSTDQHRLSLGTVSD